MVQQKESVVTAERFSQGQTYQEYLGSIERNQKRFEENYAGTTVAPEDVAKLKALMAKPHGPAKMLVIGEDWCPDVFRGMPVFARMAEATGLEMRVLKRMIEESQVGVSGTVRLKLYKGNCDVAGRKSPVSLYDPAFATFEAEDVYRQKDAEGFIRLNALRLRIRALAEQRQKRK